MKDLPVAGAMMIDKLLEKGYIPSWYPISFESGSPYEYFTTGIQNATVCSRRIIEFISEAITKGITLFVR